MMAVVVSIGRRPCPSGSGRRVMASGGQRSRDRSQPLCERGPTDVRAGRQWTGRERRGGTQDTAVVLFDYPLIQLINRLGASIVFRATPSHGAAGTDFFLNQ